MRKKSLQVHLHARQPSLVELTVGDRVQLDRVVPSPTGSIAERHGDLLGPGTIRLAIEPGFYVFRTLSDASLKVVRGGVDASTVGNDKDPWPDPPPRVGPPPPPPPPGSYGDDDLPGDMPTLHVE